jgi:hypothetical protein
VSYAAQSMSCLLLVSCATASTTVPQPETVRSHIYPLPLDNVLAQTTTLMQKKGWVVKRAGNSLVLNWQGGASNTLTTYRIFGQSIDAGLSAMRVERLVATTSTSFNTEHPETTEERDGPSHEYKLNRKFAEDPLNDSAAGVAPPRGTANPEEFARPSPWVISGHSRDADLELELQRAIDPSPEPTVEREDMRAEAQRTLTSAAVDGAVDPVANPAQPKLAEMAGIWDGTFTFRGTVVGTFSGEVTVAVDGRTVEVDDFCPERGGTIAATGANTSAAWEGTLSCAAIPISGCPMAALTYSFAHAAMQDGTLTMVAAGTVTVTTPGTVDAPPGCIYSGGALSTTFVAKKADYVHIAVTKVNRQTSCLWPADWEDLNSKGSMSMPEPSQDDAAAYLGLIRAKGSRLGDIQKLLRHCHQLVLLHGEPVLMKLAAKRPRE